MTLYLDIIWLLNFLFDSMLLSLTGVILKRKIRKRKIFFGGLIGSIIVFAPFITNAALFFSPLFKIAISVLMVWIAFGFKRMRFFFTNLSAFYLLTFAIGGALIGLHYLFSFQYNAANALFLTNIRGFGDPISWLFVIIGFPILYFFSKDTFDKWETVKIEYENLVDVEISINNQTKQLRGLVDSGNQLYDPLTKKPVLIVSLKKTAGFFPKEVLAVFEDVHQLWKENELPSEWMNKISIIPYRVVGKDNLLLAAVKPDKVVIRADKKIYQTNRLLLAFINQTLSADDRFDCIIHPKILAQSHHEQVS
ncbi:sigma-E processing peptidase SpoIIGA [Caldifermentibacillus hisashii]|uniref:sigma-E processing peptidase SpoIIGA n=1 Tax=Caldifermentibacillus hisashii TaxID=996558 RepID=UPI003100B6F2